ncbi:hypothetical protein [Bradyrhizobium sp. JYMT SZCCT0428]|uniref:hypothetical protein n=1 Tax=Bradyrhizobium sp. JYMT SZCCT0428 TaxID=2807673 RepID=UPI001BA517BD|nr:hypothetical protein [Bradyrhizobium sp. JYMT SZCCT0428]MBR1156232.1 hypothetical protein [Bradyrhizobium sp. JYMT SZCCT0428]
MLNYRAYLLDREGHIKHRVELICEDEDTARERAKLLADGNDVELWLGTRRIATFRHFNS